MSAAADAAIILGSAWDRALCRVYRELERDCLVIDHFVANIRRSAARARLPLLCLMFIALCAACATAPKAGVVNASVQKKAPGLQVPAGRLPQGVRPLGYTLELTVAPKAERFSGRTQIAVQLDAPRQLIWLHGRELHVTSVRAIVGQESIAASYTQMSADGVVALNFARPVPAGSAVLELVYDAAFNGHLDGLYRVETGGAAYAFTQFESTSARLSFPCFDEPGFKTPFDLWLTVPATDVAAANTALVSEEPTGDGNKRVHFAPGKPLPTYLVAFAVGPFDVVDAPAIASHALRPAPLPLRGLAVKGKGPMLRHALAEAGPIIAALERYFGSAYPFEKLDLVAVPDFAAGAMENPGLVTFRDWLLLLEKTRGAEAQHRASVEVMAHELAHQWVGDLVTMDYWDDLWLNEAFATWMGHRIVAELHPEQKSEMSLLAAVDGAMHADSLVSARMIRQPITSAHDIPNAFDSITYQKGAGVIAMFERYLGAATFQKGVQSYLAAHAYGNARTDDLLDALSASAGRDIKTPFNSFLTQVGVPLVAAEVSCVDGKAELHLRQERYLTLGSEGQKDVRWQIPVCVRYEASGKLHETCTLLTEPSSSLPLPGGGCPSWLMPNADAAGYYRFVLSAADLDKLRAHGLKRLSAREHFAVAQALDAGFASGHVAAKDVLAASSSFVADENRQVVESPLGILRLVHDEMVPEAMRPAVQAFVRDLYAPIKNRLGFREPRDEDGETKLLRARVLSAVADLGRDQATRKRLERLGRQYLGLGGDNGLHADALPADVAGLALRVLVEDGDAASFDALYQRFIKTDEASLRAHLLHALSAVRDARSPKALALALDPKLHVNEVFVPLHEQLADPRTRDAAWQWFEQNFDALAARMSPEALGSTPWLFAGFCSEAMGSRLNAFFAPRIAALPGGPRSLAGALEALRLCAALVKNQSESAQAFFSPHHEAKPAAPVTPPPTAAVAPAVPPAAAPAPALAKLAAPAAPASAAAAAPVAAAPTATKLSLTASPAAPVAAPAPAAPRAALPLDSWTGEPTPKAAAVPAPHAPAAPSAPTLAPVAAPTAPVTPVVAPVAAPAAKLSPAAPSSASAPVIAPAAPAAPVAKLAPAAPPSAAAPAAPAPAKAPAASAPPTAAAPVLVLKPAAPVAPAGPSPTPPPGFGPSPTPPIGAP